jgi:translocation and assembly module TamA
VSERGLGPGLRRPRAVLLAALLAICSGGSWAADGDAGEAAEPAEVEEGPTPALLFDSGSSTLEGQLYTLVVVAPPTVRESLVRHLDLARFRTETDLSDIELNRLIASAPAQARALLEPAGFFNARVDSGRDNAPAGGLPSITIRVNPGPQTQVEEAKLLLQGGLLDAINDGDDRSKRRWERLQRRWGLPEGSYFTQAAWSQSRTDLLNNLRGNGYPAASIAGSSARIDADRDRALLFVAVDSGPLFRIGEVRIQGLARTPESAARNVQPFEFGATFSEQLLTDYQEALATVGLYDGIGVELDANPETADSAAVIVRLRERQFQEASPSIGFSTDTRARVGLDYSHRRPFDSDWVFSSRISYGQTERFLNLDLVSYPREGNHRILYGVRADYLDAAGSITETQRARIGRSQESLRFGRLGYAELTRSSVRTETERRVDRALGLYFEWTRRDINNRLWPTRGTILTLHGGGGRAFDNDSDRGQFLRGLARLTWYYPLGSGWFLQTRGEAAEVFADSDLGIPDSLLFRAGGDDSVRGYGYQTLGPQRDGATVGGRKMATGTVEVMHRLHPDWRDWYGAVFVDAGDAADEWKDMDVAFGIGFGVRWRSPVGPLRMDLAWGERTGSVRLHLSVGMSF